jgi:hypothetical protein
MDWSLRSIGLFFLTVSTISTAVAQEEVFVTKITDDRPWAAVCEDPLSLPNPTEDVNNMPQGEVMIDVSEDGRLAACAKDYRYSPLDDTTYNRRVWNGIYLSNNRGQRWRNLLFQNSDSIQWLTAVTDGAYGVPGGAEVALTHESDPVLAFDRDGNIYTCALAFTPEPDDNPDGPRPSAIVVSRRNRDGNLEVTHFLGTESDARLANDKNWIAVDRTAPHGSTIVISSWRLFTSEDNPPVQPGGYIAVSADGAASFGAPIRLPVPLEVAIGSQFYQPLIGPDPRTGRKTLFIIFRTVDPDNNYVMVMYLLKADIDGLSPGTGLLHARLADSASWTYLADRITGQYAFGSGGYDGSFRFSSYYHPAIDRESGHLYAVAHVFDIETQGSKVIAVKSVDGGETWSGPRAVDYPGWGYQLMPTVAYHSGMVSVLWYDSRHDVEFAPFAVSRGIDVYYGELDRDLRTTRVLRLTPETQNADHPVFTRARPPEGAPSPVMQQEMPLAAREMPGLLPQTTGQCFDMRYGFIGDYIGLAATGAFAYAVWTDLRDLDTTDGVCAGHSCTGRRNQNIYFARIRK